MTPTNGKAKTILWMAGIMFGLLTSVAGVMWSEHRGLSTKMQDHEVDSANKHSSLVAHDAVIATQYADIVRRLERIEQALDALNGKNRGGP